MTPTAIADLSERARRVLELQAKATPGPYWHAKMESPDGNALAWISNWFIDTERPKPKGSHTRYLKPEDDAAFLRSAHDMADLIRELLEENERLRESLHLANGVADLAMKHRDAAERQLAAAIMKAGAEAADEFSAVDAGPTPLRGRVTRREG